MIFRFKDRSFVCDRTRIVGILNITDDSFSDGGKYLNPEKAVSHALKMLDDGADIIDIGGESSRPGSQGVSEEEELSRVLPVLIELRRAKPGCIISVDTAKLSVAEEALRAGADIINDIGALRNSHEFGSLCANFGAGLILMHMRGSPADMQSRAVYKSLYDEIVSELKESMEKAMAAGLEKERIIIDPGVGFSKNAEQSLQIISNPAKFKTLNVPLMFGHSRKSVLGYCTGEQRACERLGATVAASFWFALNGVEFLRVHDVKENVQAVKMAEALKRCGGF